MMIARRSASTKAKAALLAALLAAATGLPCAAASAADLVARTKIRVSLVQWMPAQGQYQTWSALGGDYEVGNDGAVHLPVIGDISVSGKTAAALADEIARKVKEKIGLVSMPSATVQVLAYPPIYVVGDVAKPGEYPFHEGQTVLQALAASGGKYRAVGGSTSIDIVNLAGAIQGIDEETVRSQARIARLQAELSGASTIAFPALPEDEMLRSKASDIFAQERVIFTSRAEGLDRQMKSLNDLQTLLVAEIDTLQKKVVMTDERIQSSQKELGGVKTLVQKGIAVASHQSDLEAQLANYQASRLDNLTAIMRARQSITEAKRNLQALQDNRKTDVASMLQQEQEKLDDLALKRRTNQKLLLDSLAQGGSASARGDVALSYQIVRVGSGGATTIAASEGSDLLPGDVLKVTEQAHDPGEAAPDAGKTAQSPKSGDDVKGARLAPSGEQEHGA